MYETTETQQTRARLVPITEPARVERILSFCYNVMHLERAKARFADRLLVWKTGKLANGRDVLRERHHAFGVPPHAFPFGHTSRLRRDHAGGTAEFSE